MSRKIAPRPSQKAKIRQTTDYSWIIPVLVLLGSFALMFKIDVSSPWTLQPLKEIRCQYDREMHPRDEITGQGVLLTPSGWMIVDERMFTPDGWMVVWKVHFAEIQRQMQKGGG